MKRGYFGIGIYNGAIPINLGTLWRSAKLLDANFIFTVGYRYKKQKSDTMNAYRHIPLLHFDSFKDLQSSVHQTCAIIGVEIDSKAIPISKLSHPEQCVYLLGNEKNGLPDEVRNKCHTLVQLPGEYSMNVAVAGSIVMYDRMVKLQCLQK